MSAVFDGLQSLPTFATLVLCAALVGAAYTFAIAVMAAAGRPQLLASARLGTYATCAVILLCNALLAYAFTSHDFRIRYVARYSDRSMPTTYLLAALWGGQDGSLLWWTLVHVLFVAAVVYWMKDRYRQLQPHIIATLMLILGFFVLLMLFGANPFQTYLAGAPPDGDGLHPLLQNFWMTIHPPTLYAGFVGCAVPFAFAVAALVANRLDNEWIIAARKWMLLAWLLLSLGNAFGMVWAYEELGWGGYWAWDPVENAGILPWFAASAYLHSTIIQERRNQLKVWNMVLICLTFLLTIFGTFLTRSGLIASVHSFAQSGIGAYFVLFMGGIIVGCTALIAWRWSELRAPNHIESTSSREAMFVLNNWTLVGLLAFVFGATLLPKITEWLWSETTSVGPPFFNRWAKPFGLFLFLLMGLCPLFGWGKTSASSLRKSFPVPLVALIIGAVLHLSLGNWLGLPPIVQEDPAFGGWLGAVLQKLDAIVPLVTISLAFFNVAVIAQEFARGVAARRRSTQRRAQPENVILALLRLVGKNRRRYGGYLVHLGIISMFVGFVGRAWVVHNEASLAPGDSYEIGGYTLTYLGPRLCPGDASCSPEEQADRSKQMLFADLEVARHGQVLGRVSPAKFTYRRMPNSPTSEVGMLRSLRDDLYVVPGRIGKATERAALRIYVNPLVSWIWIGILGLIVGAVISLWPALTAPQLGVWDYVRPSFRAASRGAAAAGLQESPEVPR